MRETNNIFGYTSLECVTKIMEILGRAFSKTSYTKIPASVKHYYSSYKNNSE